MNRVVLLVILLFATLCQTPVYAAQGKDCKDHPLFSKMPNYEPFNCAKVEFDAVEFPKADLKEWANPQDYTTVEGKIYAISYQIKEGATPASGLQIIRNFQNATKKAGGSILGDYFADQFPAIPATAAKFLGESPGGLSFERYTVMSLSKGGSDFTIYLCASEAYQDYMLLIVEKEEMKQEISVNELEKKLEKDGFLVYYINFDTGKSDIKPESQGSITQITNLLQAKPQLKVSIEGHTDNVGSAESNKKLSEERAKAVMAAVVAKGIAANRLSAIGRGQEMPIADNRKEEGRSLNRRVEIVKK